MSLGTRFPWQTAYDVAEHLAAELAPLVTQCKAVGGLRRRRPTVGDIEFLVLPRRVPADLFGATKPDVQAIQDLARTWGEVGKCGERQIAIHNVGAVEGLKCELYLVHEPEEWIPLLCIRTGPAELGKIAVILMRERGFIQRERRVVRRDGTPHPVETEEEWFALAGLKYFPPHLRDEAAAMLPVGK